MRSNQAWYWLAAGVLALGLNGAYQDGQFAFVHRLTDRASEMIAHTSERGGQFVAMAQLFFGQSAADADRAQAAIQRVQSKIVCERVANAQRQIAMAHVREQMAQAHLQQKMTLAQMKMDKVRMITIDQANRFRDCPGFGHVVVNMPNIPKVEISNLPHIEMPDLSDLPDVPQPSSHDPI